MATIRVTVEISDSVEMARRERFFAEFRRVLHSTMGGYIHLVNEDEKREIARLVSVLLEQ
jgi:hypothetical protein